MNLETLLDEAAGDTRPASVVAQIIMERAADEELYAWLDDRCAAVLAAEISRRKQRAAQTKNAQKAKRSSGGGLVPFQFAEALEQAQASGDLDVLTDYRTQYQVDGQDKALGELTGTDHLNVADRFQQVGQSAAMLAAIHRQLAKTVGSRPTSEAFTQDAYRETVSALLQRFGSDTLELRS